VIVCVLAYLLSGHRSIYTSQRLVQGKGGGLMPQPIALRELSRPKARAGPDDDGA
jgi:hypothetical protein